MYICMYVYLHFGSVMISKIDKMTAYCLFLLWDLSIIDRVEFFSRIEKISEEVPSWIHKGIITHFHNQQYSKTYKNIFFLFIIYTNQSSLGFPSYAILHDVLPNYYHGCAWGGLDFRETNENNDDTSKFGEQMFIYMEILIGCPTIQFCRFNCTLWVFE